VDRDASASRAGSDDERLRIFLENFFSFDAILRDEDFGKEF